MDLAYLIRRWIAVFLAACTVTAGLTTGLAAQSTGSATHKTALIVSEIRDSERTQLQGNIAPLSTGMVDQGQASSELKLDKNEIPVTVLTALKPILEDDVSK